MQNLICKSSYWNQTEAILRVFLLMSRNWMKNRWNFKDKLKIDEISRAHGEGGNRCFSVVVKWNLKDYFSSKLNKTEFNFEAKITFLSYACSCMRTLIDYFFHLQWQYEKQIRSIFKSTFLNLLAELSVTNAHLFQALQMFAGLKSGEGL